MPPIKSKQTSIVRMIQWGEPVRYGKLISPYGITLTSTRHQHRFGAAYQAEVARHELKRLSAYKDCRLPPYDSLHKLSSSFEYHRRRNPGTPA